MYILSNKNILATEWKMFKLKTLFIYNAYVSMILLIKFIECIECIIRILEDLDFFLFLILSNIC